MKWRNFILYSCLNILTVWILSSAMPHLNQILIWPFPCEMEFSDSMYGTEKNFFLRNYLRFSIVLLSPHSSCCLQNFIFLFEFTVSMSDFRLISALGTLEGVIILNHRNKKTKTKQNKLGKLSQGNFSKWIMKLK